MLITFKDTESHWWLRLYCINVEEHKRSVSTLNKERMMRQFNSGEASGRQYRNEILSIKFGVLEVSQGKKGFRLLGPK